MTNPVYPANPILIVDDEDNILDSMIVTLSISGLNNVVACNDSRQVEDLLAKHEFSCITLDLYMPNISGMELLPIIQEKEPNLPVIVVTGANEVELAVQCMKGGAFDYLTKPVNKIRLVTTVKNAIREGEIKNENVLLKESLLSEELKYPQAFSSIISRNHSMKSIYKYVEAIGGTSLPILITGETGAGKELLAGSVHEVSQRTGEFVAVNVAGLDDTLFSDTLFGHKKGAFTGAAGDREGMEKRRSMERSSWTKSEIWATNHRLSCCDCCRKENISPLAVMRPAPQIPGLSSPQTMTWKMRLARGILEKISTTVSGLIESTYPRCERERMTSRCWWSISWRERRRKLASADLVYPQSSIPC
jgi:CheY-like chemotaxis protein